MHIVEHICLQLRHNLLLKQATPLWDRLRPLYVRMIHFVGRRGLVRNINGSHRILVAPSFHNLLETYEPEVWQHVMGNIAIGDTIADVGAHIGLYTVAFAQTVGPSGTVIALEADSNNLNALRAHVELNHLSERVEILGVAASSTNGNIGFTDGAGAESSVTTNDSSTKVPCVTLEKVFEGRRLDVLKVDVEGHEVDVIRGSQGLLRDSARRPRLIYIEVHPYKWASPMETGASLIGMLNSCGYRVTEIGGAEVRSLERWGEIVADCRA